MIQEINKYCTIFYCLLMFSMNKKSVLNETANTIIM